MEKIENIEIQLRPVHMSDYDTIVKWSKDERFCLANDWPLERTEEEVYTWWEQCVTSEKPNFVRLGMELHSKLIGYVDLAYIRKEHQSAEVGVAIGETSFWGKGFGVQAVKKIMAYGYNELGITTFHAETHETNIRAQKLLTRLGFQEIGRNGSEVYLNEETQLIQFQFLWNVTN